LPRASFLLIIALTATAAADPPIPPPLPVTSAELRDVAATLEDGAAYLMQAQAEKQGCDGAISWKGQRLAVKTEAVLFAGPWKRADGMWSRDHDWVWKLLNGPWQLQNTCTGDVGLLPDEAAMYATVCPVPFDTTAQMLRGDADSLRKLADVVDCLQPRIPAAMQQIKADEDAKKKAADDAAHQKKIEEDAKRKADDDARKEKERADKEARERDRAERLATLRSEGEQRNQEQAQQISELMTSTHGGGNEPHGTASWTHFSGGMYIATTPLYSNIVDNNGGKNSDSTPAIAFGVGLALDLGLWHSSWLTLGIGGAAAFGALAGVSTTYIGDVNGSLFGAVGPESKHQLEWRIAIGGRMASWQATDSLFTTSADASWQYTRLEAGYRRCYGPEDDDRFCEKIADFFLATDLIDGASAPIILGARYLPHRRLGVSFEVSFGYPRMGTPMYPAKSGGTYSDPGGFAGTMLVSHNWDFFGDPHRGTNTAFAAADKIADENRARYKEVPDCSPAEEARTANEPGLIAMVSGSCYPRGGGTFGIAPGKVGAAFDFDGSMDYLTADASGTGTRFTVSAWVQPKKANTVFVTMGRDASGWKLGSTQDGQLWAKVDGIGELHGGPLTTDWNHVALVVDGSVATLYLNGYQVATTKGGMAKPVSAPLVVGAALPTESDNPDKPVWPHQGLIDEVRVFDRALGPAAIGALVWGVAPPTEDPSAFVGTWTNPAEVFQIRRVGDEVWGTSGGTTWYVGRVEKGHLVFRYLRNGQPAVVDAVIVNGQMTYTWGVGDTPNTNGPLYTRTAPTTDDAAFADPSKFAVPAGTKRPRQR
jgi:hypothetical protein